MKKLRFATAGIPISTEPRDTLNGIKRVRELGLGGMELEFVRNVNVSKELAPKVKKLAEELDVTLTCHGSYFVNLNSLEKEKRKASTQRILAAARRAWESGAFSVTFHAAFYQKTEPKKVYENVKTELKKITETLARESNKIWVRPETTGKPSQFGTVEEIVSLSRELEQVLPCIDFSHLYARSNGKFNSFKDFSGVLELIEKDLGKKALKELHCHVSGIEFGEKGERKHLILEKSKFNYVELLRAFKEFNCAGVIVCESPSIERDALLLKSTFDQNQNIKNHPLQ